MTKRQSKKRRKNKRKLISSDYNLNIIGAFIILVSIFGVFHLGLIGNLSILIFRALFGNLFLLGLLISTFVGIKLLLQGSSFTFNYKKTIGCFLITIGLLLLCSVFTFIKTPNVNFILYVVNAIKNDFVASTVNVSVGGGITGALLLSIFNILGSMIGSAIIALIIIAIGFMFIFNLGINDISNILNDYINKLKNKYKILNIKFLNKNRVSLRHQKSSTKYLSKNDERSNDKKESPLEPSIHRSIKDEKVQKSSEDDDIKNVEAKETNDNEPSNNDGEYVLPDSSLLTQIPTGNQDNEYKAIGKNTKILQKTLESFGVEADIKNVNLGPSVTEYELHPAIGVKVSKIVNLADDLALALAAKDIRIEAPIPGKSLIGIEVPNKEVSMVSFRDVIESQNNPKHNLLQVPLGRDVNGNVISSNLTKLPHLLIAGSTGSGKSVAINSIITSILMNASPKQVKFMLIDPKKVELGVYNGIPHLLSPVVSEPKKAARSLHKVVTEMENRYEIFAKHNQRKISNYNDYVDSLNHEDGGSRPKLPYIVVVIDELADLMMTVSNDVESAIIRLAQMGRAAGIHMIIATQRPSVDVITGLIKSNVPSRIAFAVSSGIDSRTILDSNGAEKLLGRGDMLYLPIDKNKPIRVQGAFIPDTDVENVVDFVKQQQSPEYDNSMVVSDEELKKEQQSEEQDDLFVDALKFVVKQQKASTSLLQRQFRIGYNRAARIIDDMEQRGYIGPQEGSKPREVYKQMDN
ncbi:DNA translocase FtsK [Apilactobacillus ozensis]|uniref:DNA translocase FtsK n=1 Tax=Apilactobacillus ozensis TaxID=866801 RepID=UPI002009E2CC|nr:DNA translocase FtsK [Apilactobacillus ozensis]MCK8607280.1 DNA translocase FtsK [Apilactobacillus ozensis]